MYNRLERGRFSAVRSGELSDSELRLVLERRDSPKGLAGWPRRNRRSSSGEIHRRRRAAGAHWRRDLDQARLSPGAPKP